MRQKIKTNPNNKQPKIKRIIFEEYSGKIRYVEGVEAEKYLQQINQVLGVMQLTRPYMLPKNFLKVNWQEAIIHPMVFDYLEHDFVADWVTHGQYHGSTHCNNSIGEESTCFIQWIKEGKPTVKGK